MVELCLEQGLEDVAVVLEPLKFDTQDPHPLKP